MPGGARLRIYWCEDGIPRMAEAEGKVYIGRSPEGRSYNVYIMDGEKRVIAEVGGPYSYVSRLHALVALGPGGKIVVKDHGSTGAGSTNGTFVNGARLPRGGEAVESGAAVVRLASTGPTLLVVRSDWRGDPTKLLALSRAPECLKNALLLHSLSATAGREQGARGRGDCVVLLNASARVLQILAAASRGDWEEAEHARRELKRILEKPEARQLLGEVLEGYLEGGLDSLLLALDQGGSTLYDILPVVKERLREATAARGCSEP